MGFDSSTFLQMREHGATAVADSSRKALQHDCTFIPQPKDRKQQAARHNRRQQQFERKRQALQQLRRHYLPLASLSASRTPGPEAHKAGHPNGVVTCGDERLVDDSPGTPEQKRGKAGQDRT